MKRSEAIYQLAGFLSTKEPFTDRHPEEMINLADEIIGIVMKLGMKPPGLSLPTQAISPSGDFINVGNITHVHLWEPE